MTPELRAARDRLARFAGPEFQPPTLDLPSDFTYTLTEVERIVSEAVQGIRETLAPDLRLVLTATDRSLPAAYEPKPKPHGHPWHACGSCSSDGMHPGNGCTNCRHTGFDQTPCRKCDDDPASRVILKPIDAERPMEPDESRCARCLTLFAGTALRSDPHRRYLRTAYCRACVQACNEAPAGHRCVICAGD